MRILLAAIAGAVLMFVWSFVAYDLTGLGGVGMKQIPNEASVLAPMKSAIGNAGGLYIFPWVDPKDPDMEKKYTERMKTNPQGILVYQPPGTGAMTPAMLGTQFLKQLVQSLIAAFLLSMAAVSGFAARVGFITLIGVSAGIATNVSYWIWYAFPLDYTAAQMLIEIVSALVAGLAIAAVLKPKTA